MQCFVLKSMQLNQDKIFSLNVLSKDIDLEFCLHEPCQIFGQNGKYGLLQIINFEIL